MTLYALMGQEKYIQNQESYVIYIQEWRIKKTFGPWPSSNGQKGQTKDIIEIIRNFDLENISVKL